DYPHYTRPVRIEGLSVPSVLLSGNHEAIRRWRRKEALRNTVYKRPDLISPELLSAQDQQFLAEIVEEHSQSLTKGSRKEVCS
ncbi:MAG: tRNA (guanosine(37)-N1)-methyltransferase TrmD, partial [Nitrospirae bacterium]